MKVGETRASVAAVGETAARESRRHPTAHGFPVVISNLQQQQVPTTHASPASVSQVLSAASEALAAHSLQSQLQARQDANTSGLAAGGISAVQQQQIAPVFSTAGAPQTATVSSSAPIMQTSALMQSYLQNQRQSLLQQQQQQALLQQAVNPAFFQQAYPGLGLFQPQVAPHNAGVLSHPNTLLLNSMLLQQQQALGAGAPQVHGLGSFGAHQMHGLSNVAAPPPVQGAASTQLPYEDAYRMAQLGYAAGSNVSAAAAFHQPLSAMHAYPAQGGAPAQVPVTTAVATSSSASLNLADPAPDADSHNETPKP